MKRVRAIVEGRVQGVWFRAHTRDRALELDVRGSVRNLASGEVEIIAEGDDSRVDELLAWARMGPPQARVTAVRVEPLQLGEPSVGFEIRY